MTDNKTIVKRYTADTRAWAQRPVQGAIYSIMSVLKRIFHNMAHCNKMYSSEILGENRKQNKLIQKSAHQLSSFHFIVLFAN